jgi:molybdopterin converting factor small subunit
MPDLPGGAGADAAVTGSSTPGSGVAVTRSTASSVSVTVRYFAAAKAAAGRDEEPLELPAPATVADLIGAAEQRHGEALARVLQRCSYLHNATAVHDHGTPLQDGDQIDVLPPFAGG